MVGQETASKLKTEGGTAGTNQVVPPLIVANKAVPTGPPVTMQFEALPYEISLSGGVVRRKDVIGPCPRRPCSGRCIPARPLCRRAPVDPTMKERVWPMHVSLSRPPFRRSRGGCGSNVLLCRDTFVIPRPGDPTSRCHLLQTPSCPRFRGLGRLTNLCGQLRSDRSSRGPWGCRLSPIQSVGGSAATTRTEMRCRRLRRRCSGRRNHSRAHRIRLPQQSTPLEASITHAPVASPITLVPPESTPVLPRLATCTGRALPWLPSTAPRTSSIGFTPEEDPWCAYSWRWPPHITGCRGQCLSGASPSLFRRCRRGQERNTANDD
jgi:hypothetical protein